MRITLGLTLREMSAVSLGDIDIVELICGEEVSCDAYVDCDDGMVYLVDGAGAYLVDDDDAYLIQ